MTNIALFAICHPRKSLVKSFAQLPRPSSSLYWFGKEYWTTVKNIRTEKVIFCTLYIPTCSLKPILPSSGFYSRFNTKTYKVEHLSRASSVMKRDVRILWAQEVHILLTVCVNLYRGEFMCSTFVVRTCKGNGQCSENNSMRIAQWNLISCELGIRWRSTVFRMFTQFDHLCVCVPQAQLRRQVCL